MIRLLLCALIGALYPLAAEAHRCPHGKILRVSMGRCVGEHSRLAVGYVHFYRSIRHARIRHHEPVYYVTVMVPADRPPKPPDPDIADIPYRLPGSRMDATPTFNWWPQ